MLRRAGALVVVLIVMSAGVAAAGEGDDVIKDDSQPGVEIFITDAGGSEEGGRPVDKPVEFGSRPLTFVEVLDAVCRGTIGVSVGTMFKTESACLSLRGPGRDDPVDAGAVARRLRDRLDLTAPQLRTSPAAPVNALVGLQTWLWVPRDQWRQLTRSASLGGTTVTVTAKPIQTRWDMGEGTKNCPSPGRVWRTGLGRDATTPCGFTYAHTSLRAPGGRYRISAKLRYRVTWTCSGDCSAPAGDLGTIDSRPDFAALEVSERQSVVVNQ